MSLRIRLLILLSPVFFSTNYLIAAVPALPFNQYGSEIGSEQSSTLSVALGDLDSDGDLDLVVGNSNNLSKVHFNDGSGSFDDEGIRIGTFGSATDGTNNVALGDLDNDGDLDLVVGNKPTKFNKIYYNDGSGDFLGNMGTNLLGSDSHWTTDIKLGDLDNDGDLDIIVGNNGQSNVRYLNNGSGGFTTGGFGIGSDSDGTLSLDFGDVDGDGDLDVVTGNGYMENNKLYLNNGSGVFNSTGITLGTDTNDDSTWSVALGDVDGDGDLDLVAGNDNPLSQTNKLYFNDSNGNFSSTGTALGSEMDETRSLVFGDVDSDGDQDLIVGNAYVDFSKLYLNDGNGGFSVTDDILGGGQQGTKSVVLGDVDGDGDLDLVAGNDMQTNKLFINEYSNSQDIDSEVLKRSEISKPLLLAKYGIDYMPPTATGILFSDVSIGVFNADWIEQLYADGITEGCTALSYCPDMFVNKEQVAILLLKAKHGPTYIPPTATGNVFDDVAFNDLAADWIEDLFNKGISTGCDANNYCPNEVVTQEGFSTLLNNTFP